MLCTLLFLGSTPVRGAILDVQQMEAATFFSELLQNTRNPIIASLAKASLNRLQQKEEPDTSVGRQVEIPLMSQLNNSLAVPVAINQQYMATFLVDTGASRTVITPRLARKLGIEITPETPRMTILTANGVVQAPIAHLQKLSLGSVEIRNIAVVVKELNQDDLLLSGLLGMDFFQNMDLTIRQNKLILNINPPT